MKMSCNKKTEYQLADSETETTRGVRLLLGESIGIEFKARKFMLNADISFDEARIMGCIIIRWWRALFALVKNYSSVPGRSGQLFKRIYSRKEV